MPFELLLLLVTGGIALVLGMSYWWWQRMRERERFLLAMKEASRPMNMKEEERSRLKLLRSPVWAIWRWLPDLWRG